MMCNIKSLAVIVGLVILVLAFGVAITKVMVDVEEDSVLHGEMKKQQTVVVFMEPPRLPSLEKTADWPPNNTEIFWPPEEVSKARLNDPGDLYRGYNLAVVSICCSGLPKGSRKLNSEYFPAHGIPYIVFHCFEHGWDHERIWRVRQTLEHSNFDFVAWMDCDAGVIAGPEAKNLLTGGEKQLDPFERFLWGFDLFHPDPKKRDLVTMVLTHQGDHEGGIGSISPGYCDNEFMFCPGDLPENECHINSGVFVARKTNGPVFQRFEQIMEDGSNVTSEVPCVNERIPDKSQGAFNWILQEQIDLTKNRQHPIRTIFSGHMNRRFPQPEYKQTKQEAKLNTKKIPPNFIFHTYACPMRYDFWECASAVQPRSAENILDECYHILGD